MHYKAYLIKQANPGMMLQVLRKAIGAAGNFATAAVPKGYQESLGRTGIGTHLNNLLGTGPAPKSNSLVSMQKTKADDLLRRGYVPKAGPPPPAFKGTDPGSVTKHVPQLEPWLGRKTPPPVSKAQTATPPGDTGAGDQTHAGFIQQPKRLRQPFDKEGQMSEIARSYPLPQPTGQEAKIYAAIQKLIPGRTATPDSALDAANILGKAGERPGNKAGDLYGSVGANLAGRATQMQGPTSKRQLIKQLLMKRMSQPSKMG